MNPINKLAKSTVVPGINKPAAAAVVVAAGALDVVEVEPLFAAALEEPVAVPVLVPVLVLPVAVVVVEELLLLLLLLVALVYLDTIQSAIWVPYFSTYRSWTVALLPESQ